MHAHVEMFTGSLACFSQHNADNQISLATTSWLLLASILI
jgi:hypothetical protein